VPKLSLVAPKQLRRGATLGQFLRCAPKLPVIAALVKIENLVNYTGHSRKISRLAAIA
jgi:hypothetical protein